MLFKVHNALVIIGFINFSEIELISQNNLTVKNKSSNLLNLKTTFLSFAIFTLTSKISVFSTIGLIICVINSLFAELNLLYGSFSWKSFSIFAELLF